MHEEKLCEIILETFFSRKINLQESLKKSFSILLRKNKNKFHEITLAKIFGLKINLL